MRTQKSLVLNPFALFKTKLFWALLIFMVVLGPDLRSQDHYLSFDGTNDYIALPISYNGLDAVPVVSVEAWVRTSFTGSGYNSNWAIVDFDRSDFYDLFVRGDDGRVGFSTYAPSGGINDFYGSTSVNDGQWHHIAAVYDGTDKHIFVDGVLDATQINPHGGSGLGKAATRFGFIGDGSEASSYNATKNNIFYNGDISEVRIWSRVLSAAELDANKFPGSIAGSEAGLFAYYTFDGGLATDLGPNNFDGGIFDSPVFNNTGGVQQPDTGSTLWSANGSDIYYTTGNVAIGRTSVPSGYKLAVDGHIRAREMRVDQDTWPDYVFKTDYDLPSLDFIQKHIREKGHLPNMPSALEVETNGIELGEMNKLLLEKIEELTLYLLKQEEKLKKQQKDIEQLKSKLRP
ncbi:MAG: LamG domain-containing protein [Flavobacteriaceae bacterium]